MTPAPSSSPAPATSSKKPSASPSPNRRTAKSTYRVREGAIYIPQSLEGLVEAVLGLDNRPQAAAHFRIARSVTSNSTNSAAAGSSFTPPQIAQLYQFPANASAAGQTIGLIELGGGYRTADLTAYFKSLGLTAPTVVAVPVDGGKNAPSTADGADGEVMLDIEVAASVAPGAKIAVYFAPNTDQGFIDAVTTAVHDPTNKPSVISISWGGPESSWTQQATTALDSACQAAALLGVTITVAAGDNGSTDGVTDGASHVDFPASSPHVLACGGTKITASGSTLSAEVVWNELSANEGATGGGVSTVFPLPAWQANANVPAPAATANKKRKKPTTGTGTTPSSGRGVPDVAGNADPTTGYTIRVDGETIPIGGTSAVAPALGRSNRARQRAEQVLSRLSQSHALHQSQRLPRHHLRQQRRLQSRSGLGPLHRPRLSHRHRRHHRARQHHPGRWHTQRHKEDQRCKADSQRLTSCKITSPLTKTAGPWSTSRLTTHNYLYAACRLACNAS